MTAQLEIPREMVLAFVKAYEDAPSVPWNEDAPWDEQDYSEYEAGLRAVLALFAERLTSDEIVELALRRSWGVETDDDWPPDFDHVGERQLMRDALQEIANALVPSRGDA